MLLNFLKFKFTIFFSFYTHLIATGHEVLEKLHSFANLLSSDLTISDMIYATSISINAKAFNGQAN